MVELAATTTDADALEQHVELSVLVPIKDEADSLRQLASEVAAVLDADDAPVATWELVFIDDGSSDDSWRCVRELAATDSRIRGLRLRRNFGKSAALAAGVEAANGMLIATMDGDLQDDPAELPRMIARLDEGADLVTGHKFDRKDPVSKRLPSRLFNWVTGAVTGLRLQDHNCGLKLGRREAFTSTPLYGEMHRYFAAISHAQGFTVVEQPVNHRPRLHGSSKFGLERYARGALDLLTVLTLTRYLRRPLHLFGGLSLLLGMSGLLILLYLTGVWFVTEDPIGNRPLLLLGALLVVVSVQLASVGLLAELLAHQNAQNEDVLRHVVATTRGVAGGSSAPSTRRVEQTTQPGEEEVAQGVDHAQDDRDRGRAGHPDQA
jgi:glycosyltransferase involved in cell wall biosynthesis